MIMKMDIQIIILISGSIHQIELYFIRRKNYEQQSGTGIKDHADQRTV